MESDLSDPDLSMFACEIPLSLLLILGRFVGGSEKQAAGDSRR